jgi:hypothetical protein
MWPQYKVRDLQQRNLFLYQNRQFISEDGEVFRVSDYEEFKSFMYDNNVLAFIIDDIVSFEFLHEAVHDAKSDAICDKHGTLNMWRGRYSHNSTRWLVNSSLWIKKEELDEYFLKDLKSFFLCAGTGVCITPGSCGHKLQMIIHQNEHMKKQTCVSIGAEDFLRKHTFGGIIMTTKTGEFYEGLKFDDASHFLAYWSMQPEGAAVWVDGGKGARLDKYPTYLVKCVIDIVEELPMGVFPMRSKRNRIVYPTLPGRYYDVYLWKEAIEFARLCGCKVYEGGGIAFRSMGSDNWEWSQKIYWLRKQATSDRHARWFKQAAVGGIGHHGLGRMRYKLVPNPEDANTKLTILSEEGEPISYGVLEEPDDTASYLIHNQRYCSSMANLGSLKFAYQFACQDRLIQVYHDSALIIERNERSEYISRASNEALDCPPGTWLWEELTNLKVDKKGNVSSDQYNRFTGVKKVEPSLTR